LPIKLFSETVKPNVPPEVPTPAPIAISPVAFSSISISITFKSGVEPCLVVSLTDAKIFLDLKLFKDLFKIKEL
jgi:hypothetical protein